MDTLNRIISIMDEKNVSQKQLTDYLGLQNTAFTKWKAGSNTSYMKHLPKISDFLGVSIDYLLGKTDQKNKPIPQIGDELYGKEAALLKWFRTLSPADQAVVLSILEAAVKARLDKDAAAKEE